MDGGTTLLLLQHIRQHVSLSDADTGLLSELFRPRDLGAKQFLFHEGTVHPGQVFVTEGCLRSYALDHNGFEHILQFAPAGWWIGDMQSLLEQSPAKLNIDAVRDSSFLFISRSDLDLLFAAVPAMEKYFRLLLERSLVTYQNRILDSLSLSARERYHNFCKAYPSLIQTLPQKQVASYIGVTPEFLSKMLNQPAKNP